MKTEPLRKLNIYMRPAQKAALQLAATRAGMSVSVWGWIADDNFMLGIKTGAETLGYSEDRLRLRG